MGAVATKATVLGIRHLTKGGGRSALYSGGGSIGIMGLARSAMLLARDPDDPSTRVLAVVKSNLAAKAPSVRFGFEDTPSAYARIRWMGASERDADNLLKAAGDPEKRDALDEAVRVLADLLASGPVPTEEVKQRSAAAGVAWATMRRAQARLHVRPTKERGPSGRWMWQLPSTTGSSSALHDASAASPAQETPVEGGLARAA